MNIPSNLAVYRVRRFNKKGDKPKKYRCTFEVTDEHTQQVMAVCDLLGQAVFSTLTMIDHANRTWQMKPNRRIMPSRWTVTGPEQKIAMQFDQKILGKLVNPLYKTVLALQDGTGKEVCRLVDTRTSIPDRVLGSGLGDWAIMSGEKPVAKLDWLPRQTEPAKGFFGMLKKKLAISDRGIFSTGGEHVFPAPVALGMLALFNELTDTSGS